jgi:hypothetical protein
MTPGPTVASAELSTAMLAISRLIEAVLGTIREFTIDWSSPHRPQSTSGVELRDCEDGRTNNSETAPIVLLRCLGFFEHC